LLTAKLGQQLFLMPSLKRLGYFWSADFLIPKYLYCSCRHTRSSGQNHYLLSHGFIADFRPVSFLGAIPQRCPHFVQTPLMRPFVGTPGCSLRQFCFTYFWIVVLLDASGMLPLAADCSTVTARDPVSMSLGRRVSQSRFWNN